MSSQDWMEVSKAMPCPDCARTDWCVIRIDHSQIGCRRGGARDSQHRIDKNGVDYWLRTLKPGVRPRFPAKRKPEPEKAADNDLNRVYRFLLSILCLSDPHAEALRARGFSSEEIERREYRSLPLEGRENLANALAAEFGEELCKKVPGFYSKQIRNQRWHSIAGMAGILIPVRNLEGKITALKVRADVGDPKYSYLSSKNYDGPGPGAQTHVPIHSGSREVLRITEGELKADFANATTGILTISIPGVTAWRQALPIIQSIQPKSVLVSFDADAESNPIVSRSIKSVLKGVIYEVSC